MITNKKFLIVLAILLLGKIFLLVVFQKLPFPLSSYFFYLICWIGALFIFYPKLFISNLFINFNIYALLYLILFNTVWSNLENLDKERNWQETLALFAAVSNFILLAKIILDGQKMMIESGPCSMVENTKKRIGKNKPYEHSLDHKHNIYPQSKVRHWDFHRMCFIPANKKGLLCEFFG